MQRALPDRHGQHLARGRLAQPHNLKSTGRAPASIARRSSRYRVVFGTVSEAPRPVDDATDNLVSVGRQQRGRRQLLDPEG